MIQICRKDKERVYKTIRTVKIDAAEIPFPNLIDDIILTMKRRGLQTFAPWPCQISAGTTPYPF